MAIQKSGLRKRERAYLAVEFLAQPSTRSFVELTRNGQNCTGTGIERANVHIRGRIRPRMLGIPATFGPKAATSDSPVRSPVWNRHHANLRGRGQARTPDRIGLRSGST